MNEKEFNQMRDNYFNKRIEALKENKAKNIDEKQNVMDTVEGRLTAIISAVLIALYIIEVIKTY